MVLWEGLPARLSSDWNDLYLTSLMDCVQLVLPEAIICAHWSWLVLRNFRGWVVCEPSDEVHWAQARLQWFVLNRVW